MTSHEPGEPQRSSPGSVPEGRVQAGARAAKREVRVLACGRSSSHATMRSILIAALSALEAEDIATACASLQDFINHAKAQSGKTLTEGAAEALMDEAEAIRVLLGCS